MPDQTANEILKKRAITLANRQNTFSNANSGKKYLLFQLGDSIYGIEASYVSKAINNAKIFSLPNAPQFILGIINENGRILCVNDAHALFGLEQFNDNPQAHLLILSNPQIELALVVDNVQGMKTIFSDQVETSFFINTKIQSIALGLDQSNVILLNAEKMLSSPAIVVNQNPNLS